jgi:dihydrofolate synthase/folylpolyglutamate synthase
MNYTQCLEYLYAKLPMFSRTGPAALKMDLSNTLAICKVLENPEKKFKCIHIAGTNGKGSVSHMLASIFQSSGYKTGLYTSPHLTDFRERIRINGQMIPENRVVSFTASMIPVIESISPSFFELTVGLAFQYFAEENVEIAIIETGLGGRLDSTNIITPELSIITNIGFDHVALLGNTLPQIAYEKAGIIKEGIPALIGEKSMETEPVFRLKAQNMQSDLYFADDMVTMKAAEQEIDRLVVDLTDNTLGKTLRLQTDLAGLYQKENIKTVYAAVQLLKKSGWNIPDQGLKQGLEQVIKISGLHGRWELLHKNPFIVADVAHNADGIKKLMAQISTTDHNNLYIILGLSADKDISAILQLLPKNAFYIYTQASIPRAMPCLDLKELADSFGLTGCITANVNQAIELSLKKAENHDLIIICGSVFIVGEIDRKKLDQ